MQHGLQKILYKNMNIISHKTYTGVRFAVIVLLICLWVNKTPAPAFAQLNLELRDADISVVVSPEPPKPNQPTTITLSSFSVNIDTLMIIWKVNGTTKKSGTGAKTFSADSPAIGESTTVTADILSKGSSIKKTIVLRPAELDMLWESTDSYVTPFYKGKSLPGSEGGIRIVAIPNTGDSKTKGDELVYTWRRNFTAAPSLSGYGKQAMTTRLNYLNPVQTIDVSASSVSGSYNAQNQVRISPAQPKILYYKIDPVLGLLTNNIIANGTTISDLSFELFAAPLFFSTETLNSNELQYKWSVSGKSIPQGSIKNRLTLQFKEKMAGTAQVSTSIESAARIFQQAQASIGINKK